MWSQLLYRRVKLNRLRLSEQSPADCCSKLSLFILDKDDWVWPGFQELFDGLSLLAQPVLVFVLKRCIISGKTENQLLLDIVFKWRICIRDRLCWYGTAYGIWL